MARVYITQELKKTMLAVLKAVFAADTDFPYNNGDITNTSIIIAPKFNNSAMEHYLPQIIVGFPTYGGEGQDTFFDNVSGFVKESNGTQINQTHQKIIRFQMSFDIISTVKAECELITDKVFNLFSHDYIQLLRELGFNVRNIAAGETMFKAQYPQYEFAGSVTITGDFRLNYVRGPAPDKVVTLQHVLMIISQDED